MLVVDPATLRDGPWRKFLDHYQLGVECVSFDELADDRRLNPLATTYKLRNDPDDYAMVVVDGAHNLRNPWHAARRGAAPTARRQPTQGCSAVDRDTGQQQPLGPVLAAVLLHPQRRGLRRRGCPLAAGSLRVGHGRQPR